ncbi:transcription elongation factor GreA [Ureaplasma diversum]|uniref:Transcription elongation factor GreA n=2 Tax=Ureaplasma diversum TaxID=42094 RepID=A0A084F1F4_9BACT|nr:transcription elongation factor GreA [Ureaplasma diversum]AJQ45398.1 transcription elongation factor GreA [Ureaplasma diversum]KEZ24046.1 Transcription elongation factor [Ureaplasma diversum NCTC 246]
MKYTISRQALKELKEELRDILEVKWPEITKQLQDAREQGDLSENADYDAAKNEQAALSKRKEEIDAILENYELIEDIERIDGQITLGSSVEIINLRSDKKEVVTIVGSMDSNPFEGKVSNETPLGKALLGSKVNETVTVHAVAPYRVKIIRILND